MLTAQIWLGLEEEKRSCACLVSNGMLVDQLRLSDWNPGAVKSLSGVPIESFGLKEILLFPKQIVGKGNRRVRFYYIHIFLCINGILISFLWAQSIYQSWWHLFDSILQIQVQGFASHGLNVCLNSNMTLM